MGFKSLVFFTLIVLFSKSRGNANKVCRIAQHDEARADLTDCFVENYPTLSAEFQNCFNRAGASDFGEFVKNICGATQDMIEDLKGCHLIVRRNPDPVLVREFQRKIEAKEEEMKQCLENIQSKYFPEDILEELVGSDSNEENNIKKRAASFFMFP